MIGFESHNSNKISYCYLNSLVMRKLPIHFLRHLFVCKTQLYSQWLAIARWSTPIGFICACEKHISCQCFHIFHSASICPVIVDWLFGSEVWLSFIPDAIHSRISDICNVSMWIDHGIPNQISLTLERS